MTIEILEQQTTVTPDDITNLVTAEVVSVIEIGLTGPQGPPGGFDIVLGHDALRAIPTITTTEQTAAHNVFRQIGGLWTSSMWFLIAGTDADDDDVIIRPYDYDGSTNAKIWVKTNGL